MATGEQKTDPLVVGLVKAIGAAEASVFEPLSHRRDNPAPPRERTPERHVGAGSFCRWFGAEREQTHSKRLNVRHVGSEDARFVERD